MKNVKVGEIEKNEGMQFVKGNKPLVGFGGYQYWNEKMNEYSPENQSGRCSNIIIKMRYCTCTMPETIVILILINFMQIIFK